MKENSNSSIKKLLNNNQPVCLNSKGGRNGVEGLQPSRSDRVYLPTIAVTIATAPFFQPSYLVRVKRKRNSFGTNKNII